MAIMKELSIIMTGTSSAVTVALVRRKRRHYSLFEENLTYCINVLDDVNFCELPLLWFVEQYWRTEEIFDVRRCATHKEQLN